MALLRGLDDHGYWPAYGTLLVRDAVREGPDRIRVSDLLKEYGIGAQPCGSIARAGDGWIDGQASDQHHTVRLEVHDSPPDDDTAQWTDAVEWPFVTGGTVALAFVAGGMREDRLRLGLPGPISCLAVGVVLAAPQGLRSWLLAPVADRVNRAMFGRAVDAMVARAEKEAGGGR